MSTFTNKGQTQIIKILLDNGADLRIKSRGRLYSVLDRAIVLHSGTEEQMTLLYASGATISLDIYKDKTKYSKIISQFILDDQEPMLDLLGLCRREIRVALLSPAWGNQKYLSSALVAQLPLP